jgi:hypothetical protein
MTDYFNNSEQVSDKTKGYPHVEQVENELAEIAAEITALGDMIPGLFLNTEDMEPGTPRGIKILLAEIRGRINSLRKYVDSNVRRNTGIGGQSSGGTSV